MLQRILWILQRWPLQLAIIKLLENSSQASHYDWRQKIGPWFFHFREEAAVCHSQVTRNTHQPKPKQPLSPCFTHLALLISLKTPGETPAAYSDFIKRFWFSTFAQGLNTVLGFSLIFLKIIRLQNLIVSALPSKSRKFTDCYKREILWSLQHWAGSAPPLLHKLSHLFHLTALLP